MGDTQGWSRRFLWAVLACALWAVVSCGTDGGAARPSLGGLSTAGGAPPAAAKGGALSPGLRAAYVRAVQQGAPAPYAAAAAGAGWVTMANPAQHFAAALEGAGVTVTADGAPWSLTMRLTGVGCEGAVEAVGEARLEAEGNRVRARREGVDEWYLNGPLGLEQGFVLAGAPACAGPKVVALHVSGGLAVRLDDGDGDGRGESLRLVDAGGRVVLKYTDLFVTDALGRELPAWLTAVPGGVAIHVDDAGATYPVEIDPLLWGQQQKLVRGDNDTTAVFGASVALSGDTAVVGAVGSEDVSTGIVTPGAAYVFVRQGGVWTQQQKLVANDVEGLNQFGGSVALSGDTALVGASRYQAGVTSSSSVYVFVRSGGTWALQQKIVAGDEPADNGFGSSVALSGNTALVGAWASSAAGLRAGAAYVFVRSGGVWAQQQKLVASDGDEHDYFGTDVALLGDTAMVRATHGDGVVADAGAVYVFARSGAAWAQQQKLVASDGTVGDSFGDSIALSETTALIGSTYSYITNEPMPNGSVYAFVRSGGVWVQQQKLVASDGSPGDGFGHAVALSGDTALIGAPFDDTENEGAANGSAYVFVRDGGAWSQRQKLLANDAEQVMAFGVSVALSEGVALVGALTIPSAPFDSFSFGAVYSFELALSQGSACTADAGCSSGRCVDGVCCDAACGGGAADDCQACSVAAGAAVDGVCGPRLAGASCRASASACDAAEVCDGVDVSCPADEAAPDGTACEPGVCGAGVCALADVVALSGGGTHTLALRADGEVLAWGSDANGQLGNGPAAGGSVSPITVSGLSSVSAVAAGGSHSLALDFNGEVWAWGSDASGQLGNGPGVVSTQVPVKVAGLPPVVALAAGTSHSLAVDDAGQVWAWGADTFGQVGDGGTSTPRHSPVLLSGLPYVLAVSAGRNHSLALDADSTVWSWGHDGFGQLGNGSAAGNSAVPTPVVGLTGVFAIAAGGDHSLALAYDGTVQAWGRDGFGQLGNGPATANVQSPALVPGLAEVFQIAAGGDHSLALLYDGTVRAWGLDGSGQLGDGGTSGSNQQSPVVVVGLESVQAISAGGTHSLALGSDLRPWSWGADAQGQLGNGGGASSQFAPAPAGVF